MTDEEIIAHLKSGGQCTFGMHGRNREVIDLIAQLEREGLAETWDVSGTQETRRAVKWVGCSK